jgi:hypothetical protein
MASFLEETVPEPPPPPPPALEVEVADEEVADEEVEEIEAAVEIPPYVRCTWVEDQWVKERVTDPKQPMVGFTMFAPEDESEIDDFCRTYEVADPDTQSMIRLSFELSIARQNRS